MGDHSASQLSSFDPPQRHQAGGLLATQHCSYNDMSSYTTFTNVTPMVGSRPNENGTHPDGWDVTRQRSAWSSRETVELEDIITGDSVLI